MRPAIVRRYARTMRLRSHRIVLGVWLASAGGCSSSSAASAPTEDAAIDAPADVAAEAEADAPTTPGTTGGACKLREDCDPDGSFGATCYAMSKAASVCIAGNCDVDAAYAPCDQGKGYCMKAAGAPSVCVGGCAFGLDGTWLHKCLDGVSCVKGGPMDVGADGAWKSGKGLCLTGLCTTDAECVAPSGKCQVESQSCVPSNRYRTFTSKPGDACTVPAGGSTSVGSDCFCFGDAGKPGYCMTLCTIGGPACGTGFACSALLAKTSDSGGAGFTKQPDGLSGYCLKSCAIDGDCASLTGGGWCDTSVVGSGVCRRGAHP